MKNEHSWFWMLLVGTGLGLLYVLEIFVQASRDSHQPPTPPTPPTSHLARWIALGEIDITQDHLPYSPRNDSSCMNIEYDNSIIINWDVCHEAGVIGTTTIRLAPTSTDALEPAPCIDPNQNGSCPAISGPMINFDAPQVKPTSMEPCAGQFVDELACVQWMIATNSSCSTDNCLKSMGDYDSGFIGNGTLWHCKTACGTHNGNDGSPGCDTFTGTGYFPLQTIGNQTPQSEGYSDCQLIPQ